MLSGVRKNHYKRNFIITEKDIMGVCLTEKDGITHLKPLLMHRCLYHFSKMPKEMHELNPGIFITAAYYPGIFFTESVPLSRANILE